MTDLDKLIEAVESGEMDSPPIGKVFGISWKTKWASAAYNGSLDASKALHEALLPGWIGYADTSGFCFMYEDENEANESSSLCIGNPARAWLLSILKAYRAQQETEQ